jgi:hypothetical protein
MESNRAYKLIHWWVSIGCPIKVLNGKKKKDWSVKSSTLDLILFERGFISR